VQNGQNEQKQGIPLLQPVDKPIDRLADQEKGRDILSK